MGLKLTTAAAVAAVSLEDAKAHCRIDIDDDDAVVDAMVAAATEHVQKATGLQLVNAAWTQTWDVDPGAVLVLHREPLVSVEFVKYYDASDVLQTVSGITYWVDTFATPPRVVFKPTASPFPTLCDGRPNVIQAKFIAGFGASDSDVPEPLRHAIVLLVGHCYETREAFLENGYISEVPRGFAAFINQYRASWVK